VKEGGSVGDEEKMEGMPTMLRGLEKEQSNQK
jgi:hypothetical protein